MIYLRKGQVLADNPSMVVCDSTGYYNDGDSVICAGVGTPDDPACRYEAKFIAYGGIVYSVSDPDDLMEQILKIDPNSLFGKTSKQVAVDTAVDQIVPQNPNDVDVATTTPVTATTTPAVTKPDVQNSTTTPPVNIQTETQTQTSTTTPPLVISDTNTSTTTPPLVLPDLGVSTTTPPLDISTTTPAVSTTTPDFTPPTVDVSTTTQPVIISTTTPPLDISTTTPVVTPPSLDVPTDTSTTSEVVAFAKKLVKRRISKGLGL